MPSPIPPAAAALLERFGRLSALEDALSILQWDRAAMMPEGAAPERATQLAVLSGLHHELLTAPDLPDLLAAAEAAAWEGVPDAVWHQANLAEIRRRHAHATALPRALVEALSHASSTCEAIWRGARQDSDFKAVQPALETLLGLVRQSAEAKAAALGTGLYDALLDEYEPGGSIARIDALFADLETFLPAFLDEVLAHQARVGAPPRPQGPFPRALQESLGRATMAQMGFDFRHGRLDVSTHPFCGGTPGDVRLTTRYDEEDFLSALFGVIHETGHALYEQGLPEAWRTQPVGRARGMSMHESQSLLWEMQVGRSRAWLAHAVPLWRAHFGRSGPAWEVDAVRRAVTRVERGFIRVEADEVTYPAHVIVRTRLERALIAGDLAVADLPGAWGDLMERLLGVRPPDDRRGCLQDIHWYDGAWGYFPTYTLGAMTAAQLFSAAQEAEPGIPAALAEGDGRPLLDWLRRMVHARASVLSTDALLTEATGRPLDAAVFKAHLRRRYLDEA
ncbi:carboxypeptidase M32 [Pararhodospirillum photometricum]|uniref:Metal-dependent carboxypeptidase n=1 Tax=Pararhodospirillum photometricum DSM 122 TaxID=1150469 RepID=H6SMK5_PARPM|nr:carboxypeptidase M32 [Pararhodospirillum photometricum]CCG09140.1 Thermostable carboxypeptidase 1 [Pararhodospirillum photometricum DSM 122]